MDTTALIEPAPPPAPDRAPLLELRGISKNFPGVKALDDVSFGVWPGEVHMLLGENGAGKSSLMKVLCGAYQADAGDYFHNGEKIEIRSPADARRFGIAVIFQEFSLVPYLDVAQNIFLGREFASAIPGIMDRRRLYREAQAVLDLIGLDVDPRTKVHSLGVAQQQMVEIGKALSQDARILVMDEPTAALSDRETERLFEVMRQLQAKGVAIVYISHRMAEVFALGDRITVLRDGKLVGSALPGETSPDELVRMMVGRNVDMSYPRRFSTAPGELVLDVRNVCAANGIRDISLTVRSGEIVGLCGLVGSGRTEVARAIFGADEVTAGEVHLFGKSHSGGPAATTRAGVGLIPESRKSEGLALIRTVSDNLAVAGLPKLFPNMMFSRGKARRSAEELIKRLRIATPSPNQNVALLSGGNQQKVVIGKWLAAGTRLFIFDEPTRGIDVGAKSEIFALIDQLVAEGAAVLMISSEQAEIVHVCDRAYVMRGKRIVGELSRAELSEENIVRMGMHDD
ncbi:sugar ABC transporter ATP-binding protein [Azorhizobium oxalatiphilum]|nr:sugar ABC transporter ATP-binding protein [Azorhizobium oxalatiphilum]